MKRMIIGAALACLALTYGQPIVLAKSPVNAAKVSTKVEDVVNQKTLLKLYQSEDSVAYRNQQLKNKFGFSENQSTGVYKRKNDVITITIDEKTSQKQMPKYTITPIVLKHYSEGKAKGISLEKGKNVIADDSEGIIHLQNVTKAPTNADLNVSIEGGVKVPRFVLGETTKQQWQQQLRQKEPVGYELVGKNTLITGGSDTIDLIQDPETVIRSHDKVVALHNQTHGLDNSSELHRTSKGLVQHLRESQQEGYWMYAFVKHLGFNTRAMIRVLQPTTQDQWGIYHEMGHTYQMSPMTWQDLTEVTVNLYSLRAQKAAGKRSRLEADNIYTEVFKYLDQTNKDFNDPNMKKALWVRLTMFWQLELAYGEEFYPALHKLYREENASNNWSSEQKQQYFMQATSKIANRNLQPFFEKWGMKVQPKTQQLLANYPELEKKIWQYRDEMTGDVEPLATTPLAPQNLQVKEKSGTTVQLSWDAVVHADGIAEYQLFRDGQLVQTTSATNVKDTGLKENTTYTYTVKAKSKNGKVSPASSAVVVRTLTETPTAPYNLRVLNQTDTSIEFAWSVSDLKLPIQSYQIYRNGQLIATVSGGQQSFKDQSLKADTTYQYTVKAKAINGKVSPASPVLTARTDKATDDPATADTWRLGSFTAPTFYQAGTKVSHQGRSYQVIQSHYNYGDPNWAPDKAPALFNLVK